MRGLLALLFILWHQHDRPGAIRRRQERALRRLVTHAYANVPFYRRLLDDAGVTPESVRSLDDLGRIPVTGRRERERARLEDLTAMDRELSRCYRSRTSGATGVPMEIVGNRADRTMMNPSFISVYLAWGLRIWQRLLFIQARRALLKAPSWYEHLGILRRRNLRTQDELAEWVAEWRRWRPALLQGYALTLKLFADGLCRSGICDVRVPMVVSTSGTLDEGGRRLIERAFGGRVIDVYASEEAGAVIAWQCPSCVGYHLNQHSLIVELLAEGRPAPAGRPGEVVITNLTNYTMPFLRHELGDVAVLSETSPTCGRHSPLLASVQGRAADFVMLPSGRSLSPHPFFLVLDDLVGIAEWRLVQTSLDALRVELCGKHDGRAGLGEQIVAGLRPLLGPSVQIDVQFVDSIRRDTSQKLRSVVSEIAAARTG